MYNEVLEALAIPEAKRADMLSLETEDRKWRLIQQHQSLLDVDDVREVFVTSVNTGVGSVSLEPGILTEGVLNLTCVHTFNFTLPPWIFKFITS